MFSADNGIAIRMLGKFEVRRPDGTTVDRAEWRTSKTRDLLRLLALAEGRPVRCDRIQDALWPDVDSAHAAASLRTAASRIRAALGADCVRREIGGLSLQGAWSDVGRLRLLADEVRRLHARDEHDQVVELVERSDDLLRDELHTDTPEWAREWHDSVKQMQWAVLADAAESALDIGATKVSADLARRAVATDVFRERPHRTLMRALALGGDFDQALRVYDRYRTLLADELGADPSPQTQSLHLQLLNGRLTDAPRAPAPPVQPTQVLRIPAQPGWGGSFEETVLRWLRDRASGATVRVQAIVLGEPRQVLALDITAGIEGIVELVEQPYSRAVRTA